jgi:hypothetical protein
VQTRGAARCREASREIGPRACLEPELRAFIAMAEWARDGLPEDAVVLSRKPTFFYHYAGHPGRTYPFSKEEGALFRAADDAGARYVVLDRIGLMAGAYLTPILNRHPGRFCALQIHGRGDWDVVLLGILPPEAEADAPAQPEPTADTGDEAGEAEDGLRFRICPASYYGSWREGAEAR